MKVNGFTLVELLVGLAVMALLASAVALTVGGGEGKSRAEAARFASRVAATRNQAILTGTPTRVWVAPSGYGFERFRSGRWEAWQEGPLRDRDWPDGVVPVLSGTEARRLQFDPLGFPANAMAVTFSGGDKPIRVAVSATGEVAVQ